jgi:hypothetical protein
MKKRSCFRFFFLQERCAKLIILGYPKRCLIVRSSFLIRIKTIITQSVGADVFILFYIYILINDILFS